ncbi:GRF1-interacting factor 1 [Apostasia shenzhenica]|uniref:GRF1-interacting factor 1 n=1 Tax=Apostasia shenzhenica TaxID=1088818 RepID=A0A2I0BCK7_9ASPA|nr:GRF1-interacting factor 1 [Apostasia shenzhenica]
MQQHLMQMQPMMAAYGSPNQVTTDIIQQYLDENKQLILAILDNQNSGKADECAENQAKLQRNLMYLAAIADSQPQMTTMAQYPSTATMQPGARYLQHQQAHQQFNPHSVLATRSPILGSQSPMAALQQQQQQQMALHSHLSMSSGAGTGFNVLHGEAGMGGVFADFGRIGSGGSVKQDMGADGRGGNSAGQNGDGTEPLYLKGSEADGN